MSFLFGKHNRADSHGTVVTDSHIVQAPEMNPDQGLGALLLLAGLLAVIFGRKDASNDSTSAKEVEHE